MTTVMINSDYCDKCGKGAAYHFLLNSDGTINDGKPFHNDASITVSNPHKYACKRLIWWGENHSRPMTNVPAQVMSGFLFRRDMDNPRLGFTVESDCISWTAKLARKQYLLTVTFSGPTDARTIYEFIINSIDDATTNITRSPIILMPLAHLLSRAMGTKFVADSDNVYYEAEDLNMIWHMVYLYMLLCSSDGKLHDAVIAGNRVSVTEDEDYYNIRFGEFVRRVSKDEAAEGYEVFGCSPQ